MTRRREVWEYGNGWIGWIVRGWMELAAREGEGGWETGRRRRKGMNESKTSSPGRVLHDRDSEVRRALLRPRLLRDSCRRHRRKRAYEDQLPLLRFQYCLCPRQESMPVACRGTSGGRGRWRRRWTTCHCPCRSARGPSSGRTPSAVEPGMNPVFLPILSSPPIVHPRAHAPPPLLSPSLRLFLFSAVYARASPRRSCSRSASPHSRTRRRLHYLLNIHLIHRCREMH
ncbi:hypothetical protein C8R43DRAFT_1031889, partial [Mycena crocata]